MSFIVYIALGTNLGDRLNNLDVAIRRISEKAGILEKSFIYQTPPWGYQDQPDFLNQVIKIDTDLEPEALLTFLKKIETDLGRQPSFRNAPRIIDLDILFFDDQVVAQPDLVIPHPRLHERAFVLVPLMDIGRDVVHPILGKPIHVLIQNIGHENIVKFSRN